MRISQSRAFPGAPLDRFRGRAGGNERWGSFEVCGEANTTFDQCTTNALPDLGAEVMLPARAARVGAAARAGSLKIAVIEYNIRRRMRTIIFIC
jgi:hypothetical protein